MHRGYRLGSLPATMMHKELVKLCSYAAPRGPRRVICPKGTRSTPINGATLVLAGAAPTLMDTRTDEKLLRCALAVDR